jgi:RHS repeat-associated protein
MQNTILKMDISLDLSLDLNIPRRNPETCTYDNVQKPILTNRGFTFHEHLEDFGLIHMNGRIYDPVLGMFLSPDNYVQAPDFTQSLNRYAYAYNNPLLYIDPDGEFPWVFAIGFVIGAYAGGSIANNDWTPWNGGWEWDGDTFFAMAFGGLVGGFGGQWLFGTNGVLAGGTSLNASICIGSQSIGAVGANFSIGAGTGITLEGIGYATAAGGGLYLTGNALNNWLSGEGNQNQEVNNYTMPGNDYQSTIRPDADGYLTLSEANEWYRNGNGQPLNVDLAKIDLSGISPSDFPQGVEAPSRYFNLLHPSYLHSINDGLVYGNIKLTLDKSNTVYATRGYDNYDFDMHPWSTSTFFRNIEAYMGSWYAGQGTPYRINLQGPGYIGK